ncbi:twin-arginine translocase subunit TatC [Francisellaceae bacterium]|nr:twin-arginine translocase subunit TatC [Francisellaceae bacterium]
MDNNLTLIGHLVEFKKRLIKVAIFYILVFGCIYPFAGRLYDIIVAPEIAHLPVGSNIVAIDVTSPFFMPLRLDFYISFLICAPFILYHLWGYFSPALLKHEKKFLLPIVLLSTLLFYIGFIATYYFVLPELLHFFINVAPSSVKVMTDMSFLLSFIASTSLCVGLIFQIPVVMAICSKFNLVNKSAFKKSRRYAILCAFIIAMFIAPDVFFQLIFAIPIYLMYEFGILIS